MNTYHSAALATAATLTVLAIAPPATAEPTAIRELQIVGDYFCSGIHTLSPEGFWQQIDGSFAIEIADTGLQDTDDGGVRPTYRYAATSDEFGDLVLDGGRVSETGFSWVYAFYGQDGTLYEVEDMWDGDAYLKVFDPFGTTILDAQCSAV